MNVLFTYNEMLRAEISRIDTFPEELKEKMYETIGWKQIALGEIINMMNLAIDKNKKLLYSEYEEKYKKWLDEA